MGKAVDIIVEQFVDKAVKQGLIYPSRAHPTPDSWKQELQKAYESYSGSQARKAAQGWYNSLVAARMKARNGRQTHLVELTSPNMLGFFPEYDPNARHSNFALTFFDTETADKNTDIIETAGFKVIYNKDTGRFERLPNATVSTSQFYGVYNPPNASYIQTEQVHGRNSSMVVSLDSKIPGGWGAEQLKGFESFTKGTILTGHNIMAADLSWIYNRPTGGFTNMEPTYKQGILDTLHLSAALLGKGNPGEQRNALQKLAQRFNVNAELPGLPAHAGWADAVKNVKVLEHLLKFDPKHPAVVEFLEAMDLGNRHSHYLEIPDPLHNSGFVTHGITQKSAPLGIVGNALKKLSVKAKETLLQDIPAVLGIAKEDYYEGNWDKSSYEEMSMAQDDEEMKEYLQKTYGSLGGGHMTLEMQEAIKSIAASAHWGKTAARSQLLRDIKGLSEEDKRYMIRNRGFGFDMSHIMHEASILEERDASRAEERELKSLRKSSGRFLYEAAREGFARADWFKDLKSARADGTITSDMLEDAKQSMKKDIAADVAWKKQLEAANAEKEKKAEATRIANINFASRQLAAESEARNERETMQSAREEVTYEQSLKEKWAPLQSRMEKSAYLDSMSFDTKRFLNMKEASERTADMTESLDDYVKATNEAILTNRKYVGVMEAFKQSAGQFYDPTTILRTAQHQIGGVRGALSGIAPSWLERPGLRFYDALHNKFNQQQADFEYKKDRTFSAGSLLVGSAGAALSTFAGVGPQVGFAAGSALVNLASQYFGGKLNRDVAVTGEGIQHRINLVAMTFDTLLMPLRAFRTGLGIAVNGFSKLAKLWEYMPSYTLSNVTGLKWSAAQPLMAADRLMGFQAGTLNNMYNNLAFQQSDLYLSGKFDEGKLVAAARLGIFDKAYAPLGAGDAQDQQADIINTLAARLDAVKYDSRARHELMGLVHQYDPNMVNILERMDKMGIKDFNTFKNGQGWRYLSDKDVAGQKGTSESARVAKSSWDLDLSRRSMTEGLAAAGQRLWEPVGRPVMELINKVIWDFADGKGIDWQGIKDKLSNLWNKLLKLFSLDNGFSLKLDLAPIFNAIGDMIWNLFDFLVDKFSSGVNRFLAEMSYISIEGLPSFSDILKAWVEGKPIELGNIKVNSLGSLDKEATAYADELSSWRAIKGYSNEALARGLGNQSSALYKTAVPEFYNNWWNIKSQLGPELQEYMSSQENTRGVPNVSKANFDLLHNMAAVAYAAGATGSQEKAKEFAVLTQRINANADELLEATYGAGALGRAFGEAGREITKAGVRSIFELKIVGSDGKELINMVTDGVKTTANALQSGVEFRKIR